MPPINKDPQPSSQLEFEHSVSNLRLKLLTPLVGFIVLLVLLLAISLFYFDSDNRSHEGIDKRLIQSRNVIELLFKETVEHDSQLLKAILSTLSKDQILTELFASADRNRIYKYIEPFFQNLRRDYSVTHFYFTRPERSVLLRVHAPDRHGDILDRITTLLAEKNNMVAYGLELGVLGTFTLRVVAPWYDSEKTELIGYIELGMEIHHIIDHLRDSFDFDIDVVISKEYLDLLKWQQGMRDLGRAADWDRFENVVLSTDYERELPVALTEHLATGNHDHHDEIVEFNNGELSYKMTSVPIIDAWGKEVAQILLTAEVSEELSSVKTSVWIVGSITIFLSILLVVFFYLQATRIGRHIDRDEKVLKELATRDSLTGLLTRRMFNEYLDAELDRSIRFEHSLALILLDIDHFKAINDTYGHQIGDRVLQELSKRINKAARSVDHICRYGGEEIAIILPETNLKDALNYAKRINEIVSALPFNIDHDHSISMTVSIGVSSFPQHGDSDTLLISAADKALYGAKESGRDRVCAYNAGE